jgi:farnesyl diphosphate synthase
MGAGPARERVDMLADQCRSHLDVFGPRAKWLRESVDYVLDRRA